MNIPVSMVTAADTPIFWIVRELPCRIIEVLLYMHIHNYRYYYHFACQINMAVLTYSVQISRRSWSGHPLAKEVLCAAMATEPKLNVTVPHEVKDTELLNRALQ